MIYVIDVLIYFVFLLTYVCFLIFFVFVYLFIFLSVFASFYKRFWLNRVVWITIFSRIVTGRIIFLMMWTGTLDRVVMRIYFLFYFVLLFLQSYIRKFCFGNLKLGIEAVYQLNFFYYQYLNIVELFRFFGASVCGLLFF